MKGCGNQLFSQWDDIFPDPNVTIAVVDRLIHNATTYEFKADSYRRTAAQQTQSPPKTLSFTRFSPYRASAFFGRLFADVKSHLTVNMRVVEIVLWADFSKHTTHESTIAEVGILRLRRLHMGFRGLEI